MNPITQLRLMTTIQKRPMTVNSHCSKLLAVLLGILAAVAPIRAQRAAWEMPKYAETMRVRSVALGNAYARDTYLSASSYSGFALGYEEDIWRGGAPDKLFRYDRVHNDIFLSLMENPVGGGSTIEFSDRTFQGFMWPAVNCSMCDLLVGPAALFELDALYNMQNSNNPVNVEGYLAAGVCVDNTFRFRLFRYRMALQATLYVPLAGLGFAPDYDQPYWYMFKYGDAGKFLHFITPFNNTAFTQQVALVLPVKGSRIRVGYTFDYLDNILGGHTRTMGSGMFTIGCALIYQTKSWDR
jgi:hypothetical protein